MEQMYLIEIFIDKITVFTSEDDKSETEKKKLIVKIKFGPKVEFIIKEGQMIQEPSTKKDDVIESDENNRRKWTRTVRVGKSYLFPSYPDTVLNSLNKFPLEIEVWNDDEKEIEEFVGIGTMYWDARFFHMLKSTAESCKRVDPLTIKQITTLTAECCCRQVGEISFILRLSAMGESILTEFQQMMKDPESFVFRTDRAPSMFQCKRVDGDDKNFVVVGSLYESTTLEDPDLVNAGDQKLEICTQLEKCGPNVIKIESDERMAKKATNTINKIRMGDIAGPCGNTNCPLANKIKMYIRNMDSYKKERGGQSEMKANKGTDKTCGACPCNDDRYHHVDQDSTLDMTVCKDCGGITKSGSTCDDRKSRLEQEGSTKIGYVFNITKFPHFNTQNSSEGSPVPSLCQLCETISQGTGVDSNKYINSFIQDACRMNADSLRNMMINNPYIYNVEIGQKDTRRTPSSRTSSEQGEACDCVPPKPTPACKAYDCECTTEAENRLSRKKHQPYCPAYKHKSSCPVMKMKEQAVEVKAKDDDEDEEEPLPYGLPPISLGPCPILGRPCAYPDGFSRMYKTALLPPQPPSYNEASKAPRCSREYERITKYIKEYMNVEKENDFRCVNQFNVDTERRCCDKEQLLTALDGTSCCGRHKLKKGGDKQ